MDVERKKISEKDYVGRFLLRLYHRRIFGHNGKVDKVIIVSEFRDYMKTYPYQNMELEKVETLLQKHEFLYSPKKATPSKTNNFTINMIKLREYSRDIIKRLDEAQKQQMFKRITLEHPLGKFKEAEQLEIDPKFEEEELIFRANYIEHEDKKFVLSSNGCCICQKNFESEIDYIEHIQHHTQKSYLELRRTETQTHAPFVRVSYQICKKSPFLRFSIASLQADLKICKVIIVRETSMMHPLELDVPFLLSAGERNYFNLDRNVFEIGREQPLVIVFKDVSSRDAYKMHVEQHNFLRMDAFNAKLLTPKPGTLECKTPLEDYFPPSDLRESEMSTIYANCPRFLEYERNNKIIDENNIEYIYTLLLQLEDTAIFNLYSKFKQEKATIISTGEFFSIWLELDDNITVEDILKEGDRVELSRLGDILVYSRKSRLCQKIYGSIEKISNRKIIFSVNFPNLVKPKEQYDVMFRPFRYFMVLQYRALRILKYHQSVQNMLFPVKNQYPDEFVKISISPFNENLAKNPEQLEAVERIVHHMMPGAPYVIFGPPGTGKTTTIVEAIYQLWKDNPTNKILVVGGSNACVDEIAIRLLGVFKEIDSLDENMLRIYSSAQGKKLGHVQKNLIEVSNLCYRNQFYPSLKFVYKFRVVFATLSVAAMYVHGGLAADHFSHVFIDECGASTEPEVIAALIGTVTCRTKVILAGDPKQLGPVLQSKTAEELGLGVSLLERLMNLECYKTESGSKTYDRSIQIRLTKNFRTHPSILNMSNELYYESSLQACANKSLTSWASNWYNLPSPNFPVIFHSVNGKSERRNGSQSLYNWAEMLVVMNYIKEIMYFGINGQEMEPRDIGIVTPYKSQVNLIRKELDSRKWFEIDVGSVEKFQGQERPVILLSTVRSRMRSLGFLVSPKRLNVALTRAQALLIIVGNPETLSLSPDYNYVINYCKDNGAFKEAKYSMSRPSDIPVCSTVDDLVNDFNIFSILSIVNLGSKEK